jgi:Xaa-Pro aminopeptidase
MTTARATELSAKLARLRAMMAPHDLAAVVLRGVDWFAWVTCGGSSAVLLGAETGVAEVVVTPRTARVVTDEIEAARLAAEELPDGLAVSAAPWTAGAAGRQELIDAEVGRGRVASDRPRRDSDELPLPDELARLRWGLVPEEIERYRALGADAARAVSETLSAARPEWTGHELAGAASRALWARGVHPMLALVAGEGRLPRWRHPTPSAEPLGAQAMLVLCARRHGLYANLTRFITFRAPTAEERARHAAVAEVEAAALAATRPGARLDEILGEIIAAYAAAGFPGAEREHHQGGPCGYQAREALATPDVTATLPHGAAVAWNPSVTGAKIEDTFVLTPDGLVAVTHDPSWPSTRVHGRARPDLLVRAP